jgi:organic hydroperoxide reductase OsmC/OhrA
MKIHQYNTQIIWTGNTGKGTETLNGYRRDYVIEVEGKPEIPGTSEISVQSNKVRYNPEELLQAAVSSCHMLWYLYLCAQKGIIITEYVDKSRGTMESVDQGGGRFTNITLGPKIKIKGKADLNVLNDLQDQAHHLCYIANSCNFPIAHEAEYFFE